MQENPGRMNLMKFWKVVPFMAILLTTGAVAQSTVDAAYQKAVEAHDSGEFNKAIELYTKVIEADPEHADAYWNRGNLWSEDQNDRALEDYRRVTELAPLFDGGFGNYGYSLLLAGRFDDAYAISEKAMNLDNSVYSWPLNMGHAKLLSGDIEKAREFYRWALYRMQSREELNSAVADFDIFIARGWSADQCKAMKTWMQKRYDGND